MGLGLRQGRLVLPAVDGVGAYDQTDHHLIHVPPYHRQHFQTVVTLQRAPRLRLPHPILRRHESCRLSLHLWRRLQLQLG